MRTNAAVCMMTAQRHWSNSDRGIVHDVMRVRPVDCSFRLLKILLKATQNSMSRQQTSINTPRQHGQLLGPSAGVAAAQEVPIVIRHLRYMANPRVVTAQHMCFRGKGGLLPSM